MIIYVVKVRKLRSLDRLFERGDIVTSSDVKNIRSKVSDGRILQINTDRRIDLIRLRRLDMYTDKNVFRKVVALVEQEEMVQAAKAVVNTELLAAQKEIAPTKEHPKVVVEISTEVPVDVPTPKVDPAQAKAVAVAKARLAASKAKTKTTK